MKIKRLCASAALALCALTATAQTTKISNLYVGQPDVKSSDPTDTAKVYIYFPAQKENTGRAIVICPGGGYTHLAIDKEGREWGEFFQNQGITAVVLKYRMPHGNADVPISDATHAMRLVRDNAASWGVNPDDVGIMGFSAGGHLASTIATKGRGNAKADFQILFYPVISMMSGQGHQGSHDNLLGKKPGKKREKEYSNDQQVSRITPRAFIALSDDDDVVQPANGVQYYVELYKNDRPASLHVYPSGGHGWGARIGFRHHDAMMLDLKSWLKSF